MRTASRLAQTILLLCGAAGAIAADTKVNLDITRVALFNSGVGYFEREAAVTGNVDTELRFRTEQINDILKSLVVQDFGGGQVSTVGYASRDPIERTLRSFAIDLTGQPTLGNLLNQLRGEAVTISGPQEVSGTIVGVETAQKIAPGDGEVVETTELLTLFGANGLQRIPLTGIRSIQLQNPAIAKEFSAALSTLATGLDADKKAVEVQFRGVGERRVRVAYLLETPIWKTSYRLTIGQDQEPFLQGWATVDNTTESDWDNVQLSLISGRPISFRMDLYTPLYVPRPLEQLELYASLRPPEFEGALMQTEALAETLERMPAAPPPPPGAARTAGRAGGGGAYFARGAEKALSLADGVASVATAEEAGELFAYHIDGPVSIPRQHSAMLPIVNQPVEAEKLSVYSPATHPKYPVNALKLTNTTGLNLMQGPVTVFEDDLYAGDAKLPDLKPKEERLVAYALDLATEVSTDQQSRPQQVLSVRIVKGVLWQRRKYVDERVYHVKNKRERERIVIIEQPFGGDWKLVTPAEPYEKTDNALRFKVEAPAQKTTDLTVTLERTANESLALSNANSDLILQWSSGSQASAELKQAVARLIELRQALDQLKRQLQQLQANYKDANNQQARVRENLKTLDRETDAYRRQLKQFDEYETQIQTLDEQTKSVQAEVEQQQQALEAYLIGLSVD